MRMVKVGTPGKMFYVNADAICAVTGDEKGAKFHFVGGEEMTTEQPLEDVILEVMNSKPAWEM
jgi:hypothetical protein